MLLRVTDYHDLTPWRSELLDAAGNHLADHEVQLEATAQEYRGYDDSPTLRRILSDLNRCLAEMPDEPLLGAGTWPPWP